MSEEKLTYRCDKAMRRSKERCNTPLFTRWRCTGDCLSCPCCLIKDENGEESHRGIDYSKGKKP